MQRPMHAWWLNPAWIFTLLCVGASYAAYLVPARAYRDFWRVGKYFEAQHLEMCLATALALLVGAALVNLRPLAAPTAPTAAAPPLSLDTLMICLRIAFVVCVAGYAAWIALAVNRGLTLSVAAKLLSGEGGAAGSIRRTYLEGVSGVTSCTQFGLAAMVLAMIIALQHGWRRVWPYPVVLCGLALARAIFNSEREAIIELVVPSTVLCLDLAVIPLAAKRRAWRWVVRFTPIAGAGCVVMVFSAFEYVRSWVTYYSGGEQTFWEFILYRLSGYYVTAMNNVAFLLGRLSLPQGPSTFTLNFAYRLPVVKDALKYLLPTILDFQDYPSVLMRGANPEFDNTSGILLPYLDYGLFGGILYWVLAGMLFALLFRWFRERRAWGLCLYPVVFLHLLEVPRGLYLTDARAFPAIAFLSVCAFFLAVRQTRSAHVLEGRVPATARMRYWVGA